MDFATRFSTRFVKWVTFVGNLRTTRVSIDRAGSGSYCTSIISYRIWGRLRLEESLLSVLKLHAIRHSLFKILLLYLIFYIATRTSSIFDILFPLSHLMAQRRDEWFSPTCLVLHLLTPFAFTTSPFSYKFTLVNSFSIKDATGRVVQLVYDNRK